PLVVAMPRRNLSSAAELRSAPAVFISRKAKSSRGGEEESKAVSLKASCVMAVVLALGLWVLFPPARMQALPEPAVMPPVSWSLPDNNNSRATVAASGRQAQLQPAIAAEARRCRGRGGDIDQDRQFRVYGNRQPGVLYVLGEAMMRARRYSDAARLFRSLLELDPGNLGGRLGLAGALSANGCYASSLEVYAKVLRQQSANYAALQGTALVLLWTGHLHQARLIFQRLALVRPEDAANHQALASILRAGDLRRRKAMRPRPGAPPAARLGDDVSYLAAYPTDEEALRDLAKASAQLQYFAEAIRLERRAIQAEPRDQDLQAELANLLAWDHQYGPAIAVYESMLKQTPDSRVVLENLAKTYDWSGQLKESRRIERRLSAEYPSDGQYQLAIVRLDLRLHDDEDARKRLENFLRVYPGSREAELDLANLDLRHGRLEAAEKEYEVLLGQNFQDPDALYGAARIDYYLGDLDRALPLVRNLADERPKDFDALLLLARIESALHKRKAALAALDQASALSPDNQEVQQIRRQWRAQSPLTLQTSAYYARETSFGSPFLAPSGVLMPGGELEDLNSYGASTRIGFRAFPRTSSYVLTAVTPTNSPSGGIQGAAAPEEILYGQATQFSGGLTLRGGLGLVRMGPGEIFESGAASTAIPTVGLTPVGYLGSSLRLTPKLTLNFTVSQTAITYTPAAARFGARQTRIEGGARYNFDPRTRLGVTLFHDRDVSSVYDQTINSRGGAALERSGRDSGNGASLKLSRTVVAAGNFSLDIGYNGLAFGYAGQRQGVFMGFFNPTFYQRHFITAEA
ncbi:MAG: tetratricopeptide repeat protein, partial [Terracidiphilus sp.]